MTPSYFSPDIVELLGLLARHRVMYLVVGGEAVIHYGHARLTGDIDLFYEAGPENATRLFEALREFWGGSVPQVGSASDLLEPGVIVQFGVPPNRVDLMSTIDAVAFAECWERRVVEQLPARGEPIPVPYIGLQELIRNKEAVGRPRDQDDLLFLRRAAR